MTCHFQVQISDGTESTIATLLAEPGEDLLSIKAEHIYETINIKKEPMPLQRIQQHLADKVFKVQLKKSYFRNSNDAPTKLFILSFDEKQATLQLPASSASLNVGESSKRELQNISSPEEPKSLTIGSTSSSKRQQIERATPIKKMYLLAEKRVSSQALQLRKSKEVTTYYCSKQKKVSPCSDLPYKEQQHF